MSAPRKQCAACDRHYPHTTRHFGVIAVAGVRPRIYWDHWCRFCREAEPSNPLKVMSG